MRQTLGDLQPLRFEIAEAARMLRLSRSTLYERIRTGEIEAQRDGRRRYITASELRRYVASHDRATAADGEHAPYQR